MATIRGVQTVNDVWVIETAADPTTGGGTAAPIGSIALAADGSGTFTKFGALNTDWSIIPSNSSASISITGLTQIDMTGLFGTVTVILTSANPAETINEIINATNVTKIIFQPAAGLTVTFNDVSGGGLGANIHLFAPTQIPVGSSSGYLEVTLRSGEWYETDFIDSYN